MSAIKHDIETITPVIAEKMLEKNTKNRTIQKRYVGGLVKAILNGEWKVNGEAIKIANDGTLLDGQNRLAAIMVSKTKVDTLVVRGLSPDVMPTLDIGKPRNNGNHLQMAGYTGSVFALAAAVGICLQFSRRKYTEDKNRISPAAILNYLDNNKRILKSLEIYTSDELKDFRELLPQSVSVATHYLFTQINRDEGEKFFHALLKGTNLGDKSPILKLRTELISMRKDTKRGYVSRRAYLHFMTTAYQLYLEGKRPDRLPVFKREGEILLPKMPE